MINLDLFKNRKWYRQGGLIQPIFDGLPYLAISSEMGHGSFINVYVGEKNYGYFDKDAEEKLARKNIKLQLKDHKHIDKVYANWKKVADELLLVPKNHGTLKDIIPLNFKYWQIAVIIEYYDPHGDTIFKEFVNISDEDKVTLLFPTNMSNVQKERLELLHLIVDGEKEESIKQHQKKYFYIKCSWADGSTYTVEDIKKKIEEEKKKGLGAIKKEIVDMKKHQEEVTEKKNEILAGLNDEQKKVAYFFQKMTDWREERKIVSQQIVNYTQQILLKMEKETKIPLKYLKFMDIYNYENELNLELLKERSKLCANLYDESERFTYYTGEDAKQIKDFIEGEFFKKDADGKVLKGMPGNKGCVKGRVKIVMETDDFDKFEDGDILVTAMTRPEFVPIMKKAKAIVTDEGGITCHAAIVARELGIPCIIATHTATGVLKDGMVVEVDGGEGVVRVVQ